MVSNIFYFHPYLGKIPILTNIFQMGWNHQLEKCVPFFCFPKYAPWRIPWDHDMISPGPKHRGVSPDTRNCSKASRIGSKARDLPVMGLGIAFLFPSKKTSPKYPTKFGGKGREIMFKHTFWEYQDVPRRFFFDQLSYMGEGSRSPGIFMYFPTKWGAMQNSRIL